MEFDGSMTSAVVDEASDEEEQKWREAIAKLNPRHSTGELSPHQYTINDIPIAFPYEAYESQHQMMTKIIYALKRGENCLLESPTGTGKTAALLCAVLGWQKYVEEKGNDGNGWPIDEATLAVRCVCKFIPKGNNFKIIQKTVVEKHRETVILERYDYGKKIPEESRSQSELCRYCVRTYYKRNSVPVIYYATNTLSQVKQVAKELKSTVYTKGIKMSILASRHNTCLNDDVLKSTDVNDECQKLRNNYWRSKAEESPDCKITISAPSEPKKICERYAADNESIFKNYSGRGNSAAWDIEDLNLYSKAHSGCSYYGLKVIKEDAKIIFCTFNQILHGGIREAMNVDLTNSVIVFDEAHNVEELCREISTVVITQRHINAFIIPEIERALSPENSAKVPLGIVAILHSLLDFFQRFTTWFTSQSRQMVFNYEKYRERHKEFSEAELAIHLEAVGFTKENVAKYKNDVSVLSEVANGKKKEVNADTKNSNENEYSQKYNCFEFSTTVIIAMSNLFYRFYYILGEGKKPSLQEHYKAVFTKRVMSSRTNNVGVREYQFEIEFQNFCLNPAITFEELKRNAHSIIISSATLSPLHSFESELNTPFPVQLSAPHIIKRENVFSSLITTGPNKVELSYNHPGLGPADAQVELVRCVLNICKVVPGGVVVFLPSRGWLTQLRCGWAISPILNEIKKVKKIFFEQKQKKFFLRDMKEYAETIAAGTIGCVLFAVFRGKVSECVDFKDDQARAVVTVGIPDCSPNIPSTAFKMMYNDAVNASKASEKPMLSGIEWYQTQAFRALNQAFGRCVRHRNDWGSVIIIEKRMELGSNKSKLSQWVAQDLQTYQNFNDLESSLEQFNQAKQIENQKDEDEGYFPEQDLREIPFNSLCSKLF